MPHALWEANVPNPRFGTSAMEPVLGGPMRIVIRPVEEGDRPWIDGLLRKRWSGETVVTRGKVHRPEALPGFVAFAGEEKAGLLTYRIEGKEGEIVTLDSLEPGRGIGTALLDAFLASAREEGLERVWIVTTNDNTKALRFYQMRGFVLVSVHRDALERSRKLKPEIPLTGLDGIPLRDEIELELRL